MSTPGTRHFIGPLTPAQQRRRVRSREEFRDARNISEYRCVSMGDAFKILRRARGIHIYHGYATGQYP